MEKKPCEMDEIIVKIYEGMGLGIECALRSNVLVCIVTRWHKIPVLIKLNDCSIILSV